MIHKALDALGSNSSAHGGCHACASGYPNWSLCHIAESRCCTPLFDTSLNGPTETIRILIAAGAGVNIADRGGRTPLHHASFHGHTDTVRALIAAGADGNIADRDGWTPLHYVHFASAHGRTDTVRVLRDAGGV